MNNKLSILDLASAFSERYGMDQKSSVAFVKAVFEIVEEYVAIDKLVKIKGFGTFKLVNVSDRESVNVNTGERIVIAGHTKLTFTPDALLRDAVNRPFSDFETTPLNEATSIEEMERIPAQTDDETSEIMSESETNQDVDDDYVAEETGQTDVEMIADEAGPLKADALEEQEVGMVMDVDDEAEVLPDKMQESTEPLEVSETDGSMQVNVFDAKLSGRNLNEENPSYPMSSEPLDIPVVERKSKSHRWLCATATITLMVLSYFAGHYRVFEMIDFNMYPEAPEGVVPAVADEAGQVLTDTAAVVGQNSVQEETVQEDTLQISQDAIANQQNNEVEEDPAEIAKYFPQVPGGEYWIVGDAGYVHHMQVGETLYRIARKELGDQNLVRYLIVFNKFEDPNIIHTGDPIRIPKLVKKDVSAD